jgi:hypothetical protein
MCHRGSMQLGKTVASQNVTMREKIVYDLVEEVRSAFGERRL